MRINNERKQCKEITLTSAFFWFKRMDNYYKLQNRTLENKIMIYDSFVNNIVDDKVALEELAKKLKAIKWR